MNEEPAIIVRNVKKRFKIPLDKTSGIKQLIVNFYKRKKGYREFKALDGVTFEVKKGEFFGVVGRNGSGKSTLLKILAGVYNPDSGNVKVNGSLTPFIELGVGFNHELTGRENVFLNGALLGFSRAEMEAMYDEIVDFAELHDFMEERLKNYSSGMQVRLAFSIAIRANTDILILDEVLAVGDAAFQQKCADYFDNVGKTGKTIILVTHSMTDVEKYCTRALLLEEGRIKKIGSPRKIANLYTLENIESQREKKVAYNLLAPVKNLELKLVSNKALTSNDSLEFKISYELSEDMPVDIGISVLRSNISLIEHNTKHLALDSEPNKKHTIRYRYALDQLNPGVYEVAVAIFDKRTFTLMGYNTVNPSFNIITDDRPRAGLLVRRGEWVK